MLHRDIHLENLLINDLEKVAVIKFDQSMKNPSTEAMALEMGELINAMDL